ncbi:hypothetical protein BAE44_0002077 [Dichanthelium oligosanthes]|uniref:Gnk2-homologous domain-containing protein n=1 Tax=Dichanthelium oligosanthes TaxID=888268 RepID=A0A1E5WHP6_9POAL|nr:hypothetical protein BAE44_0002077 [Dichanthelium oligosanthes]
MSARLVVLLAVTASLGVVAVGQEAQIPQSVSDYSCSGTNFTDGSQYEKNLDNLVSTMSTAAAANGNGWFRSGSVGAAPDQASGLIMCYADSNVTECLDCLRNATRGDLKGVCPHSRGMSINYGGCLLRYAETPFLGTADTSGWLASWWTPAPNTTDMATMNETRWRLLSGLTESVGDQPLRFLNGSQAYTDVLGKGQVVYGLVQCTRDLPPSECTSCLKFQLRAASDPDMVNSTDGSVKGFSCYLRYQLNDPIDINAALHRRPPAMSARLLILLTVTASLSVVAVGNDDAQQVPASVSFYTCSSTNYTHGGKYEKNLNNLVSTLSTEAAANGNGWFRSVSVGASPYKASGLIMCYADTSVAECQDCLRNVSRGDLQGVCPQKKSMSVNYGGCLLRYSDEPFLGIADVSRWLATWWPPEAMDVASMNKTRWWLLSQLAESAGDQHLRFLNGSQAYTRTWLGTRR